MDRWTDGQAKNIRAPKNDFFLFQVLCHFKVTNFNMIPVTSSSSSCKLHIFIRQMIVMLRTAFHHMASRLGVK